MNGAPITNALSPEDEASAWAHGQARANAIASTPPMVALEGQEQGQAQPPTPGLLDITRKALSPEGAGTLAATSLAVRGTRNFLGIPMEGGLLGGLKKPMSAVGRAALPLAAALEAGDAITMPDQVARQRFNDKLRGKVDTELPLGLGTVKGDDLGGYLFNNAMEPGKNVGAIAGGVRDTLDQRAQLKKEVYQTDVADAARLKLKLQKADLDPAVRAETQKKLDEMAAAKKPGFFGRTLDSVGLGEDKRDFDHDATMAMRRQLFGPTGQPPVTVPPESPAQAYQLGAIGKDLKELGRPVSREEESAWFKAFTAFKLGQPVPPYEAPPPAPPVDPNPAQKQPGKNGPHIVSPYLRQMEARQRNR